MILSQRSFSGGELAPSLYARVDTNKYSTGLRTCRNMQIMRHGGAQNRSGTYFIGEVKDSTKAVKLIPFIFNDTQTYVLEFGDQYMRVIRDSAYQYDLTLTITGITNANPAVLTYTGTDPSNGEEVYISGVIGNMSTYVNNRNFKIVNINTVANTFELDYMDGTNVNSTTWGSYTSGGTAKRVYTISTPYVEADLQDIQYVQSADIITLAHPNYAPRELSRTGHTSWTLSTITFAPLQAAPTGLSNTGAAGSTTNWVVTAVATETYEESLASSSTGTSATPTSGSPITVSWSAASGAQSYNIYKSLNGVYGFIGSAVGTSFIDTGIAVDPEETPPASRNPFNATDDYPSTVTYFQQRLSFANTNNNPETVWTSRTGHYKNFTTSNPLQDDDAVTFTMSGRQVNSVRHLLDLGRLLVLTSGGEWTATGGVGDVLTPTTINLKQYSYNGSSILQPVVIGNNALFLQSRGTIVRDLTFDYQVDGYTGNDLTIFSTHLFEEDTIIDWAYQQIPNSILWAVRSDGTLLGFTYVKEHQVFAWHRHDFNGTVENVISIPNGSVDEVYIVVKRTINGSTKRYIERMTDRLVIDVIDNIFMDSTLTYDGRDPNPAITMTLSGGTTWTYTETLTLTASAPYFGAAEVGNSIFLYGTDGTEIRCNIVGYTSGTVVSVKPHTTVPVAMRSVALNTWTRAVDQLTGLWHLEGENVAVFADRFVVASPNNEAYTTVTVTNGTITLEKPYGVVHVGIPYYSDLETLDIDSVNQETMIDKKKNIGKVTMMVEKTRGIWVGAKPPEDDDTDPLEGLYELKIRNSEGYDDPVTLKTEPVDIILQSEWNSNGRVFVRQVDPIPLTILSISPSGYIPSR